jgi:hypothetical protein
MPSRPLTVSLTQVDLAQANRNRVSLTIINPHATATAYFKEGGQVTSANGIPVRAGGYVSITYQDDGDYVKERFVVISDTVATILRVIEGLKIG